MSEGVGVRDEADVGVGVSIGAAGVGVGVVGSGGDMQPASNRLIRIICKNFTGSLLFDIK